MTCQIQLGSELPPVGRLYLEVNVRCTARIRNRRDCSKSILAIFAGYRCPETLKIFIVPTPPSVSTMTINAIRIALPDFQYKSRIWLAGFVHNPAHQVKNLTSSRFSIYTQFNQVIVGIER